MISRFKMPMKASYIAVLAVFCAFALCAPAFAQDKNAAKAPTFGHIDLQKVFDEFKKRPVTQDLAAQQTAYNGILERLVSGSARFLNEVEIRNLAALYEKPKLTDEEKKRVGALQQKGDDLAAEYKAIEQTGNPTPAQTQKYTQLEETQKRGTTILEAIRAGYGQNLEGKQAEMEGKVLAEIKAAIGKVATEKGLSAVFTANVAIWTANDITADVIKIVGKG